MRLVRNSGTDRGVDSLREWLTQGTNVDLVSPSFSLFAFAELRDALDRVERCRLLLGEPAAILPGLLGGDADIASRGALHGRWLARLASDWIKKRAEIRHAKKAPPQSLVLVDGKPSLHRAMLGTCSFTTEGLGVTPGGRLGLVQATESDAEAADFAEWFRSNWDDLEPNPSAKAHLLEVLDDVGSQRAPSLIYFQILYQMFKDLGDELDEERIIKSATGKDESGLIDRRRTALDEHARLAREATRLKDAQKSVFEHVIYDSGGVERTFAEQLEKNESVKIYAKLPAWFKVPTPLGTYNPDWAVLVEVSGEERLYFVVETKGSMFVDDLRDNEAAKIACGEAHFKALAVGKNPARYIKARTVDDLMDRL